MADYTPSTAERGHKGAHSDLSAARLREILHYDPDTGVFTWKVTLSRRNKAGNQAGFTNSARSQDRIKIGIAGTEYMAHRLAWLYMTGKWPPFEIDHVNKNGRDNRWVNLRLATSSQNQRNRGLQSNNTTGLKGTCFDKRRGCFVAGIKVNGRRINLGSFDTVEEAHAAYCAGGRKHYGEFFKAD